MLTAVVSRAVQTAELVDDECLFDRDDLAAVLRYCDTAWNSDAVLAAVDTVLQQCVQDLDAAGARAAGVLRARIVRATARRQLPVENIQGDIGAGRGAPPDVP
ncbi:MAG: hypothetical protein JWO22_4062 [Frankiales bacterium]|nr:hypothetical protein [Frankiales bacterium]